MLDRIKTILPRNANIGPAKAADEMGDVSLIHTF